MATYIDVHVGMKGMTHEQLAAEHQKDLDLERPHGVHFAKAWADPESGRVFCLSEAPSKEAVRKVHQAAGHPADEIFELPLSVG